MTVAKISDVPPGTLVCVDLDGVPITLANVDGRVFALAAYCTHQRALLEEGELEGTTIVCPWHTSAFDLETGRVLSPPATEDLPTYPVQMAGEDIQVDKAAAGDLG